MTTTIARKSKRLRQPQTLIDDTAQVATTRLNGRRMQASMAQVPDSEYHTTYVSRKINGVLDLDVFRTAHAYGLNILLEGPTGPGKTSAVMAYAAHMGVPFYSVSSNVGVEPSQLFGRWNPDNGWHWVDGGVTTLVRNGGVLLLNEMNFLPERVATVIFSLLDKRRMISLLDHESENIRAHRPPWAEFPDMDPCWCEDGKECPSSRALLIVADMNPDYEGTRPLNKALRNRFPVQIDWDYDDEVEAKLVSSVTLLEVARGFRQLGDIETPTTTNMLQEFERLARMFSIEFAVRNFIQHYNTDERESIKSVFEAKMSDLTADFTTPVDDGFGDVFSAEKSAWAIVDKRKIGKLTR